MSGHSKWSTIKHKKAITDNKRGQIFTKFGRAITIAAKEGGGDIGGNFKLRLAVDKARAVNMPKVNIDRAIEKGVGKGATEAWETAVYEGFGPSQVTVIVEVVTDNKNRTAAELKKIFERGGGRLGQPGSVSYLFTRKGRLWLAQTSDVQTQILELIDLGVDEVEESGGRLEVLVSPQRLGETREQLAQAGYKVEEAELIYKPQTLIDLNPEAEKKLTAWLDELEELDDVQAVYTNW